MQVHNDLQTCITRPTDSLVQHIKLTLDKRLTLLGHNRPVTDRDSDVVHASSTNLLEVVGGDERIPMLRQSALGAIAESFGQTPFVNGTGSSLFKERRCNPRLQDQPAAKVDTSNFFGVIIKSEIAGKDYATTQKLTYRHQFELKRRTSYTPGAA